MTAITMKERLVRALYVLIVVAVLPFLIWNGFIQQVSAEWNESSGYEERRPQPQPERWRWWPSMIKPLRATDHCP